MLDRHTSLRLLRASCRPVRVGSAFLLSMALACTASAATLHVTNLNDAGAGSLRQAVQAAADGDIVTFDLGGDITLSSMIQIDRSISIEGPLGGPPVRIDGALSTSLFQVGMGRSVALTRLSLLNASNAVRNYGQLTLTQVLVRGNSASMGAGVTGCVDPATQVLNVFDSVFIDNRAQNGGGAIAACGQINISTSTFADNSAIYGGALAVVNTGSVNITNSTFADNTATGFGGAITTDYPGMALTNVTFSGNSAPTGSALMPNNGAVVNVRNTLFSGGSGGGHCGNPVQGASNLNFADPSGANSCGSSVTVIADPQLGALGDNGGPTPTMALAAGSPAIDAGAAAGAPATDQRGVARPQGAGYDIGAYERAAAPPGPGADGVTAVPTLGEWALVALAALLGLAAARRVRRPGATDASHRIGALVVWCAGIAASGAASALTVTHLGDSGPGSLRDAVASTAPGGTVDFAPGLTGAIALASGDILINKALTITGPGASTLAVTHNAGRIFRIDATGADVSISGLRLTGTGGPVRANGGAILNISGQLSLDAIHIEGSAVVGDWQGGGIGGAIHSAWSAAGTSLTIRNSTLNSNSATKAGAIHAYQQTLIIENSTIAGNSATDSGGAVSLESSWNGTAFRHVTIHGNSANIGSGVYARQNAYADFVNTIVAQNNDPGPVPNDIDRGGGTMSATGSLFSELNATNDINSTNVNNQFGAHPLLNALANNGGTTPTLRPQGASPVINAAACIGISPDQRGMPRPQGAQCDIGAVEIGLIIASNESFTVPAAGGMTASVVVNDSAFEQPVALGSNASLTPGTAPAPVVGSITMAADGTISVAPSTTPGSYSYAYTLCVVPATNPASCGTASATVTVQAAAGVAPIPTLGQWGLLLLGLLLGGTALRRRT